MDKRATRRIGNMYPYEIVDTPEGYLNRRLGAQSLAAEWAVRGISYELTDPVPTDAYTSEELKDMGMVGVVLILPPEDQ